MGINVCEFCDGELPEDYDHIVWDGLIFCTDDCLFEYLEDGE